MSDTKPLLFIDTVQTKVNENIGQTVYDSRKANKGVVLKEEKKEIKEKQNAVQEERKDQSENKKESSKLVHQANLLDRRAKQNHFVFVQVESTKGEITGYFKGLVDHTIRLSDEEGELLEISLNDIEEIKILKV